MLQELVLAFDKARSTLLARFKASHPERYEDIVRWTLEAINDEDAYEWPDPSKVHTINDGDYQGTLVFVIPSRGYQPSTYYVALVGYGSCSTCDTLQGIRSDYHVGSNYDDPPTDQQANSYLTLALHIVQRMKKISN